jgi:hypothetical protein
MKCRSQLDISSKFNIANEYVLCRYKWHHPIVLTCHWRVGVEELGYKIEEEINHQKS